VEEESVLEFGHWYEQREGSTAEVKGSRAWLLPVVDFGVAIGLVVGFLLDVVLRKGRGLVGGGDHVSSCAGVWGGLLLDGSERKSTRTARGSSDVMYTWPCEEAYSPHKHDHRWRRSLRGWLLVDDRASCALHVRASRVKSPIVGRSALDSMVLRFDYPIDSSTLPYNYSNAALELVLHVSMYHSNRGRS
jgi:hypothetical protein